MFDQINTKAPENFRRFGMREDNAITERLPRFAGSVEVTKERFTFVRSGSYPESIFAHHSAIAPAVLDQLEVGSDVNFRVRFNRAGPVAIDMQLGRQID
ncbi:cold shock domain-containing protein [Bradyrhizobium niftali]|uniref:cold shock domain-containing protein n=1 Tax=Bradyrhizobium niftali TaxID=2560055 RepID=UPI001430A32E|nr:cold shock domain-containing protein [Bradyrhizobium niftali]